MICKNCFFREKTGEKQIIVCKIAVLRERFNTLRNFLFLNCACAVRVLAVLSFCKIFRGKLHFSKLVAPIAEVAGDLFSIAAESLVNLGVHYGGVDDIEIIALSEIGNKGFCVPSLSPANIGKGSKAAVECLKLRKVAVIRNLGVDDHVITGVQRLHALADGANKARIVIGGNKVKSAVKEMGEWACKQAEDAGKVDVPMLLFVVINLRLILIKLHNAGVHLRSTPHTKGSVKVDLHSHGRVCSLVVTQNHGTVSDFFAEINEGGLLISAPHNSFQNAEICFSFLLWF